MSYLCNICLIFLRKKSSPSITFKRLNFDFSRFWDSGHVKETILILHIINILIRELNKLLSVCSVYDLDKQLQQELFRPMDCPAYIKMNNLTHTHEGRYHFLFVLGELSPSPSSTPPYDASSGEDRNKGHVRSRIHGMRVTAKIYDSSQFPQR